MVIDDDGGGGVEDCCCLILIMVVRMKLCVGGDDQEWSDDEVWEVMIKSEVIMMKFWLWEVVRRFKWEDELFYVVLWVVEKRKKKRFNEGEKKMDVIKS